MLASSEEAKEELLDSYSSSHDQETQLLLMKAIICLWTLTTLLFKLLHAEVSQYVRLQ